jgi:predicted HTH domain antitoxin
MAEAVMDTEVLIAIPRDVLHTARMSPAEIKRELAVTLFQQGRLSFGKARELAGMSVWAFQLLLGSRSIPVHYDIDEYLEDRTVIPGLAQS